MTRPRRPVRLLVFLTVFFVAATSVSLATSRDGDEMMRQRCLRPEDRIRFETADVVVVYTAKGARRQDSFAVKGCLKRLGRRFRIDQRPHLEDIDVFPPVGSFVVSAAYDEDEEGTVLHLTMVDLRTGKLYRVGRTGGVEGPNGSVFAVALKPNGSVAWLTRVDYLDNLLRTCEIRTCYASSGRAKNRRILDRGDIQPKSVRLSGSMLSWLSGGTRRRAILK